MTITESSISSESETVLRTEKFFAISKAVAKLQKAMFATLTRSDPVDALKKQFPTLSVTFGPQLEKAKGDIRNSALKGDFSVFARGRQAVLDLQRLSPKEIDSITQIGQGLPDSVRRLKRYENGPDLFEQELLVNAQEFADWMKRDKKRGRWPSQRKSKKPSVGRPALIEDWAVPIRRICAEAQAKKESGIHKDAVAYPVTAAEVQRRLAQEREHAPSEDTVARMMDQLYCETGDPKFQRKTRSRKTLVNTFISTADAKR